MALPGGQYTVTATAATLTSALGLSEKIYAKGIDIKAKATNAAPVYIGASNVTNVPANAKAEILAGQGWNPGPVDNNGFNTDEIFIVGTAADIVFIAIAQ